MVRLTGESRDMMDVGVQLYTLDDTGLDTRSRSELDRQWTLLCNQLEVDTTLTLDATSSLLGEVRLKCQRTVLDIRHVVQGLFGTVSVQALLLYISSIAHLVNNLIMQVILAKTRL